MGLISQFNRWKATRREQHIDRLTATAADLPDERQYDLLFLHQRGFVRARGSGHSITEVYADVENLIRRTLRVAITPGTYFVSSGGHQNMAATAECTFTLDPCSAQHIRISAVCINANRPIPRKNDRFYGVARVDESVARFLEASRGEDPMVVQAGVWTLTDNYSRSDVIGHLVSRDDRGHTWHPVTNAHCDRAREILEKLGIPHRLRYSDTEYEKKTEEYADGVYSGEFRYGERHGLGKYTWKDGRSYEGRWENGQAHGEGTFITKDGRKHVGRFERGRAVEGSCYDQQGDKSWSYIYVNGEWVKSSSPDNETDSTSQDTAGLEPGHHAVQDVGRSQAAARGDTCDDGWRFCVKCRKSDFWVHTPVQQGRWKAGRCPYCEGELIDRATYRKVYGK
jgi:hypothetical protein